MISMQNSNIPFYVLEKQRCVGFSVFRVRVLTIGREKNSGDPGVETPSELCFGTSEIE